MSHVDLIVVTGPTASGKTRLAVELARRFEGEIVSADSRQVYTGMDIGTGKDLCDYHEITHHLIDKVSPHAPYHLSRFLEDAQEAIHAIISRQKRPIVCGGTPLWLYALLKGYAMPGNEPDPQQRNARMQQSLEALRAEFEHHYPEKAASFNQWSNKNRLIRALEIAECPDTEKPAVKTCFRPVILAPYYPRKIIHQRVRHRLEQRLNDGMLDEAQRLLDQGITHERLDFFGLEYRYMSRYIQKTLTYDEFVQQLFIHIRQFVKRQDIWFRKFERDNLPIHWIAQGDITQATQIVQTFLDHKPLPQAVLLDTLNASHMNDSTL